MYEICIFRSRWLGYYLDYDCDESFAVIGAVEEILRPLYVKILNAPKLLIAHFAGLYCHVADGRGEVNFKYFI